MMATMIQQHNCISLCICLNVCLCVCFYLPFTYASPKASIASIDTRLKPIYHSPGVGSAGYSGDPNGLMYRHDKDRYHLFWQHIPDWPANAGGVRWGHAVSRNFAQWTHLPDTLGPGAFSGGATQFPDGNDPKNTRVKVYVLTASTQSMSLQLILPKHILNYLC